MLLKRYFILGTLIAGFLSSSLLAKNSTKKAFKELKTQFEQLPKVKDYKNQMEKRKERKGDLQRQKNEIEAYHENSAQRAPDTYPLCVAIVASSVKLMEKHYGSTQSYVDGLLFLSQMKTYQDDAEMLVGIKERAEVKLAYYQSYAKKGQIDFRESYNPEEIEVLEEEAGKLFGLDRDSSKTVSYLMKAARQKEAGLDCTSKGGTAMMASGAGAGGSHYHLKCRSVYGRRMKYAMSSVQFMVGWGGMGSGKRTKYKKTKEGSAERESKFISYSFIRKKKIHVASSFSFAGGVGATVHMRNKSKDFGGVGAGLGVFLGVGVGGIRKLKDRTPDFRDLFEKLGIDFSDSL